MSKTTALELLFDAPSEAEVASVDALWSEFNSTTQFLVALKRVLIARELSNEVVSLERFLVGFSQVEANDLNEAISDLFKSPTMSQTPITQRG